VLAVAALAACGPRPYRTVPLPVTSEKLPVRIEATLTAPTAIATMDSASGAIHQVDDVVSLRGDVRAMRGDTMVVEFTQLGYANKIVLQAQGIALLPTARVARIKATHIPSAAELDRWDRKSGRWAIVLSIVLTVGSLLLSVWLTNLLN
jgi:hypothetical protein